MKTRTISWMLGIAATAAIVFLAAGFAPAGQEQPKVPVFAKRQLPLEWNGASAKPNYDHMFRRGHARQATLDHMFRKR